MARKFRKCVYLCSHYIMGITHPFFALDKCAYVTLKGAECMHCKTSVSSILACLCLCLVAWVPCLQKQRANLDQGSCRLSNRRWNKGHVIPFLVSSLLTQIFPLQLRELPLPFLLTQTINCLNQTLQFHMLSLNFLAQVLNLLKKHQAQS